MGERQRSAYAPMIELKLRNDPDRIGRFRIIGRLGAGGFGTVYVAGRRDQSDELVAVKVMQSRLAGDRAFRVRFGQEIRAIERISSNCVPHLVEHGVDGEGLWLATQLVHGPSLHQVVERSG